MKFTPSDRGYDRGELEYAMRIRQITGGSEFYDLKKYLGSCNFERECAWIRDFLRESKIILRAMENPINPCQPPFPETAISTAILGPIMRLLGFYSNGLTVFHEVPISFKLVGDAYSRTIEEFNFYENETQHEVEGRIDFLILSDKPEKRLKP